MSIIVILLVSFILKIDRTITQSTNFKFNAAVADTICHALFLDKEISCVNSGGNNMVDAEVENVRHFLYFSRWTFFRGFSIIERRKNK